MASPIIERILAHVQIPQSRLTHADNRLIQVIHDYYINSLDEDDLMFWVSDTSLLVENIFDDIIRNDMKKFMHFKRLFCKGKEDETIDMFKTCCIKS
jgi:hypothetical protein